MKTWNLVLTAILTLSFFVLGTVEVQAARTDFSNDSIEREILNAPNRSILGSEVGSLFSEGALSSLPIYEILEEAQVNIESASGFNGKDHRKSLRFSKGTVVVVVDEKWIFGIGDTVNLQIESQDESLPLEVLMKRTEWVKLNTYRIPEMDGENVYFDQEGNLTWPSQVEYSYAELKNNCRINDSRFKNKSVYVWSQACNKYDITRHKNGRVSKSTLCFSYVKWYLLKKGLISEYFISNRAKDGHFGLWNNKFRKWKYGNKIPIRDLVCVYTGGRSGHIEVWVEEKVKDKNGKLVKKAGWFWGPYKKDRRNEAEGNPDKNILFKYPMNHHTRFGRSRPLRSCWYKGAAAEADKARVYAMKKLKKAKRRAALRAKNNKNKAKTKGKTTPVEFKLVEKKSTAMKYASSTPRACRSKHKLPSVNRANAKVVICYSNVQEYKGRKSTICGYGKGREPKDFKEARENRYRQLKKWQAEVRCGKIKKDNLVFPKPLGKTEKK